MKKIKYILIAGLFLGLFTNDGFSQFRKGSYISSLEYSMAFNTGRANDFLSDAGYAGMYLSIKTFFKKNVAAGINVGYNVVAHESTGELTELPNGAIYGPQARYLNYAPIMGTLSYHFVKDRRSKFMPYVQANVGAVGVWQRLQVGVTQIDNDTWHFGFGPEAGFMVNLGNAVGLTVNGKYTYALSSGTTLAGKDGNSYSFINANIGLAYIR